MKEKTQTTKLLELFDSYFNSFENLVKNSIFSLLIILGIAVLVITILFVIRKLIRLRMDLTEESVLLELTPPAITEKSAYTTQQLFSVLYDLGNQRNLTDKLLGRKTRFSFEIVSTLDKGIRYIVRTTPNNASILQKNVISYLPHVRVKTIHEYLPYNIDTFKTKVIEFKLSRHFAYPLAKQNNLEEYDPVAYITGMMTKLSPDELISFQLVLSPTKKIETNKILRMILRNEDVLGYLNKPQIPLYILPFTFVFGSLIKMINLVGKETLWAITEIAHPNTQSSYALVSQQKQLMVGNLKPARVISTFEQEAVTAVQEKINQSLFEASLRVLVVVKNKHNLKDRTRGIKSSFGTFSVSKYQSLQAKHSFPIIDRILLLSFKKRLLSSFNNTSSTLLSVSEVADLYHFPFMQVAQTENTVKVLSHELPAPLSLKNNKKLSVVFGKNTYGGTETFIGLSDEERKTHMYIIGRTGSGKTTLMFTMAKNDIESGAGMGFIDPHGDVSMDLLNCIPKDRIDDLLYFNPFDLKHPMGINLLELTPGLDEDEAELEKEVVCEGVVSLFRKVFSKEENANAHRIEYVLRNTIHTAFTIPDRTIFTLYDLLNNPPYQKQVIAKLEDENLKNFWKFEFGRAGDYQVVKMVGGVTAKIGRFLFSPTAKRILEQKKSTINFNDILDGKILICNLSQGKLGEDTARLLGTTILTKIQQAALKRSDIPQNKRKQFHLYVDEFQNFATLSFAKMLSEGRKYGLDVCIAEQSTSQQQDRNITNIILSNVTTVVSFRTGNPIDEQLLLSQFAPYVKQGEIQSLPRYRFYIKISAIESEEPFSGETIKVDVINNPEKVEELIEASRKNNAIVYKKPEVTKRNNAQVKKVEDTTHGVGNTGGVPNTPEFQEVA